MFRSSIARLAAMYTAAFALAVAALGAFTVITSRAALGQMFDDRIRFESASLIQQYRAGAVAGLERTVRQRDQTPGALDYGLEAPGGVTVAGRLRGAGAPAGWSVVTSSQPGEEVERNRVLISALPGGYRLLIGDDMERIEDFNDELLKRFAIAFIGVVLLGAAGGYGLSRGVHRRIAAMIRTAEAIIDGDLTHRVPTAGGDDDLGRLAATFNRMLDRIGDLLESLRQASGDIAHELRTPLTRLRQRLEAAQEEPEPAPRTAAIEGALADMDAILATFAALLRIAQIESGARRAGFRPTDLTQLAGTVVEAFAPSSEDAGGSLVLEATGPLVIDGDPELLTQMLANLVENGLRHGGPRAVVQVRVARDGASPVLEVTDKGPGVPQDERARLFDRFRRLEASRSTPGSGLGLALVAAVAKLHDAEVTLHDARPGLACRVTFPTLASRAPTPR